MFKAFVKVLVMTISLIIFIYFAGVLFGAGFTKGKYEQMLLQLQIDRSVYYDKISQT